MVTDITAANIPNLTATSTTTVLTLTEANGNAINIYNGNADTGGYNYVGSSNVSGLNATTSATGTERLTLTRSNGGPIDIYEATEYFRNNVGIASGHTGMFPLALNIEQGIRTGGTTLVGTISARDSLSAQAGDQAYVTNAGDGEWGLYLYDGSSWVEISNQDSATVDAKTLTTTFTMPSGGFGNSLTNNLGNISQGRKITTVSVQVHTPFASYSGSTLPNIEVGTIADPDIFVDSPSNDLTDQSDFMTFPEYIHPSNAAQELVIRARCNHYTASSGNVTVKVTYI